RTVMGAWERFVGGGALLPSGLRSIIEGSWQRCLSLAVDPGRERAPKVLPAEELFVLRRRHRELVEASARVMVEAHDFLAESGTIMMLTDPAGVVLQSEGDPGAVECGFDIRLMAGADWSEASCGTNAIGTALSLGMPVQVHAGEHFCLGP